MQLTQQLTFLNNSSLKIIALCLGTLTWSIFHETHYTVRTVNVPLCFYNQGAGQTIKALETVTVTLRGKKEDMRHLDWSNLALHINAATLQEGVNSVEITAKHLLLPQKISMVNYTPVHVLLSYKE